MGRFGVLDGWPSRRRLLSFVPLDMNGQDTVRRPGASCMSSNSVRRRQHERRDPRDRGRSSRTLACLAARRDHVDNDLFPQALRATDFHRWASPDPPTKPCGEQPRLEKADNSSRDLDRIRLKGEGGSRPQ